MLLELFAEFLGTFIFLFIILQQGQPIPIAVGLLAVIYMFGNISGGHFNPAVSIMMGVKGDVSTKKAIYYIVAQVLGGLCALLLYKKTSKNLLHQKATADL
jgi:glycerol uptake facilitator-like aquaporin